MRCGWTPFGTFIKWCKNFLAKYLTGCHPKTSCSYITVLLPETACKDLWLLLIIQKYGRFAQRNQL